MIEGRNDVQLYSLGSGTMVGCVLSRDPDVNHDGTVNIIDLARLAFAYGSSVGSSKYDAATDLEADGTVDILDVATGAYFFDEPVY